MSSDYVLCKIERNRQECENARIAVESNFDCIFFYSKGIIYHESVPKVQNVNSKFYKKVIKNLSRDPGIFCTIMHRRILQVLSPNVW
jgi:hypothetical protein